MKQFGIILLLFLFGLAASAQDGSGKQTPEQKATKKVEQMTAELGLSAEQVAQVKTLLIEKFTKIQQARTDYRNELNTVLTDEQKAKLKTERKQKGKKKGHPNNGTERKVKGK